MDFKELTNDINFKDKELVTKYDLDIVMKGNSFVEFEVKDSEIPKFKIGDEHMIFLDYDIPMCMYKVKGYYHSFICRDGLEAGNDYYICRRDEEPSVSTLSPYSKYDWNIWGMEIKSNTYRSKHSISNNYRASITRNGKEFDTLGGNDLYTVTMRAQHMIFELENHSLPFNFMEIDFDKKIVGYKCKWKGRPCTITSYIMGQNCVVLDILGEVGDYAEGETIKDHLFSSSFEWYKTEE